MDETRLEEVGALVNVLYAGEPCGCCLHIVLDDDNVDDGAVEYCRLAAVAEGHPECVRLAEMVAALSLEEREALVDAYPR